MKSSRETNSIFDEPWWLNAVAPKSWDCIEIEESGKVVARLPFVVKKKLGFTHLGMPPLTQTLGPWIENRAEKSSKSISREVDLYTKLIKKLPKHDHFLQSFSPKVANWMPFYWEGFGQTTCYTYALDCNSQIDSFPSGFNSNTKRNLKRASQKIKAVKTQDLAEFHRVNGLTFARQGMDVPYSRATLESAIEATSANGICVVLNAEDEMETVHASILIVGDSRRCYLLASGFDPQLKNSGAGTLLVWEAIKAVQPITEIFDFEGSMLPGVEIFYRGFGASQTPYFQVSKSNKRGQAAVWLRNLGRKR